MDDLDRDLSFQLQVVGQEHAAECPLAQLSQDSIVAQYATVLQHAFDIQRSIGRRPTGWTQPPGLDCIQDAYQLVNIPTDAQAMNDRVLNDSVGINQKQTSICQVSLRVPDAKTSTGLTFRISGQWKSQLANSTVRNGSPEPLLVSFDRVNT